MWLQLGKESGRLNIKNTMNIKIDHIALYCLDIEADDFEPVTLLPAPIATISGKHTKMQKAS